MIKRLLTVLFLFLSINSFAQNDKEEAKDFYKKIIKSYFDTCTFFLESLNDSIIPIGMHEGFYFPTNKIGSNEICNRISQLKKGLNNYNNYENAYQVVAYSKNEFTTKPMDIVKKDSFLLKNENVGFVMTILNLYKKIFTNNDYLIVGNFPKNEDKKQVLNAMFWFILRKKENGWKIIAMHE